MKDINGEAKFIRRLLTILFLLGCVAAFCLGFFTALIFLLN